MILVYIVFMVQDFPGFDQLEREGANVLLRISLTMIFAGLLAVSGIAFAAEAPTVLLMHNKQFEPKQLEVPGGVKVKLVVRNMDAIPAEFESYDLSREIVVPGHSEIEVYVGPLEPGRYEFFNDFNHDMQGAVVVKPAKGN
jgi:Cupredoxin-like domain